MIMISSKGRYALRVMTYLAVNAEREFVPLKEIAEAESISLKYLESLPECCQRNTILKEPAAEAAVII